jgi:hypothetical protein
MIAAEVYVATIIAIRLNKDGSKLKKQKKNLRVRDLIKNLNYNDLLCNLYTCFYQF